MNSFALLLLLGKKERELVMNEYVPLLMFPLIMLGIFSGFPVAFSLMGAALLFGLMGLGGAVVPMMIRVTYKTATSYVLAAVPLFVFMGTLLARTKITDDLYHAAQMWIGQVKGGIGIATIFVCVLFAACTGIIGSSVIVIGLVALPAMLKLKYDKGLASAVICAGGALGTIIPPSVVLVVLGPTANVSIGWLFFGAIFPGLLLASLYSVQVGIRATINPSLAPPLPPEKLRVPLKQKLLVTLRSLVPTITLFGLVMGSIMLGLAAPTEAAALGAFGAVVLSAAYRRLSLRVVREAALECLGISCMVMFILMGGTLYTGVFVALGGGKVVETMLAALHLSPYGYVVLTLFIVFLGGFMLDWASLVMIFIPLFIPFITVLGFDPVWYCILFAICIQTSYITPPMAPAIFFLRGIAPEEVKTTDMYRGVIPFVVMQLIALALLIRFPQMILWLPGQLLKF